MKSSAKKPDITTCSEKGLLVSERKCYTWNEIYLTRFNPKILDFVERLTSEQIAEFRKRVKSLLGGR